MNDVFAKCKHKKFNMSLGEEIKKIQEELKDLRENHLHTLSEVVNEIKVNIAEIRTNLTWLQKFFFIVVTASVGGLLTAILNLILK